MSHIECSVSTIFRICCCRSLMHCGRVMRFMALPPDRFGGYDRGELARTKHAGSGTRRCARAPRRVEEITRFVLKAAREGARRRGQASAVEGDRPLDELALRHVDLEEEFVRSLRTAVEIEAVAAGTRQNDSVLVQPLRVLPDHFLPAMEGCKEHASLKIGRA